MNDGYKYVISSMSNILGSFSILIGIVTLNYYWYYAAGGFIGIG